MNKPDTRHLSDNNLHLLRCKAHRLRQEDRIELHYLPPYSPQANPDGWLNRDLKTELRLRPAALDKASLKKLAEDFMAKICMMPGWIMRHFTSAPIRYAA